MNALKSIIHSMAALVLVSCTGALHLESLSNADLVLEASQPLSIHGLGTDQTTDATEIYLDLKVKRVAQVRVFWNDSCSGSADWMDFASPLGPFTVARKPGVQSYSVQFKTQRGGTSRCFRSSFTQDYQVTRAPWFETQGTRFMNFLRNTTGDFFTNDGQSCVTNQTSRFRQCFSAGTLQRSSVLRRVSTCTGVSAYDSLGLLDWECVESSGQVYVRSTGFAANKGLADVIHNLSFRPMKLHITTPTGLRESIEETWWSDPILELPDNSLTTDLPANLTGVGNIYSARTDRVSSGYFLSGGTALVMPRGLMLRYSGRATNNCDGFGGPGSMSRCLVGGRFINRVWLEGQFEGVPTSGSAVDRTVSVGDVTDSYFRNIFSIGGATGLSLHNVRQIQVEHIQAAGSSFAGVSIQSSMVATPHFVWVRDIKSWKNGSDGIRFVDLHTVNTQGLRSFGNTGIGIYFTNTRSGVFSNIISTSNMGSGISVDSTFVNSSDLTIQNAILAFNNNRGLSWTVGTVSSEVTLSHVAAFSNAGSGIYLQNLATPLLNDILVFNNSTSLPALEITNSSDLKLGHMALAGGNLQLAISDITGTHDAFGSVLIHGFICSGTGGGEDLVLSDCGAGPLVSGPWSQTSISLFAQFKGLISGSDIVNPLVNSGVLSIPTDVRLQKNFDFQDPWRIPTNSWSTTSRGVCNGASCLVADLNLIPNSDLAFLAARPLGLSAKPTSAAGLCNDMTMGVVSWSGMEMASHARLIPNTDSFPGNPSAPGQACTAGTDCVFDTSFRPGWETPSEDFCTYNFPGGGTARIFLAQ